MKRPCKRNDTDKQEEPTQNEIKLRELELEVKNTINQTLRMQRDGVKINPVNGKKDGNRNIDEGKDECKKEDQSEQKENNKLHGSQLEGLDEPIVCPNPIVVNSSGITGIFDIQRVVMTMLDTDTLRSKIKNAASAYEMIDGWCTISTGLGLTMVAFSCERHMLKQQMNVADVIVENVLRDPHEKRPEPPAAPGGPDQGKTPDVTNKQSVFQSKEKTPEKTYGNSPEQRKVWRMINFVTESDLHVVAGEWVLARFSGSPGAKWFLCRLELGNGNTFYARRIATDDFDFHGALPEEGLVQYWYEYLQKKKTVMCDIISWFLNAKMSLKYMSWLMGHTQDLAANNHESESSDDEKNEDEPDENMKQKKSQYWELDPVRKYGRFFVRLLTEESEKWIMYIENELRNRAMAKVPTRLQAAIEALDEDKGLLPVMFHSARDVHFF